MLAVDAQRPGYSQRSLCGAHWVFDVPAQALARQRARTDVRQPRSRLLFDPAAALVDVLARVALIWEPGH
jgi:hypothetical protein